MFCCQKGKHSIGVLYYLLARMVLQMRGTVTQSKPWDVMVDLFFYREPEETKEEEAEPEKAPNEQPAYGGSGGFAAPQGEHLLLIHSSCPWDLHVVQGLLVDKGSSRVGFQAEWRSYSSPEAVRRQHIIDVGAETAQWDAPVAGGDASTGDWAAAEAPPNANGADRVPVAELAGAASPGDADWATAEVPQAAAAGGSDWSSAADPNKDFGANY